MKAGELSNLTLNFGAGKGPPMVCLLVTRTTREVTVAANNKSLRTTSTLNKLVAVLGATGCGG